MREQLLGACETVSLSYSDVATALDLLEDRVNNPGDHAPDVAAMLDRHAFEAVRAASTRLETARDRFEQLHEDALYELGNRSELEAAVWRKAITVVRLFDGTEGSTESIIDRMLEHAKAAEKAADEVTV